MYAFTRDVKCENKTEVFFAKKKCGILGSFTTELESAF